MVCVIDMDGSFFVAKNFSFSSSCKILPSIIVVPLVDNIPFKELLNLHRDLEHKGYKPICKKGWKR